MKGQGFFKDLEKCELCEHKCRVNRLRGERGVDKLSSISAKLMGADRIFFSGGEPTIHLPYIEEVVEEARKIRPDTKVNFDTNGYMTEESLRRV